MKQISSETKFIPYFAVDEESWAAVICPACGEHVPSKGCGKTATYKASMAHYNVCPKMTQWEADIKSGKTVVWYSNSGGKDFKQRG